MTSVKPPTCRECDALYINDDCVALCAASQGQKIKVSLHALPTNCPRSALINQQFRDAIASGSPVLQAMKDKARQDPDLCTISEDRRRIPAPPVFTRPPSPRWRISPEDFNAPIPKAGKSDRTD